MTNYIGIEKKLSSINLNPSPFTGDSSNKFLSLLGSNAKVAQIALGAITLLVLTGSGIIAKNLWVDQSKNTNLLKFGPNLPPHLPICSNFELFSKSQCEAPWSSPNKILNNKTPLKVQPVPLKSASKITSHESIIHCLKSTERATCGHTVLNNLDELVQSTGSEYNKTLEVFSQLLEINHDWASELALTCLRTETDCFPLDNIGKLDNSHTASLALACTQIDNEPCNKIVDTVFNKFVSEDLSHVREIFEACLLSNSSQCKKIMKNIVDPKQNCWISGKVAEACEDSKEVVCHNVALNTFNECYSPGLQKKIIDLIFSNINFLKANHNELLNRTVLKLISFSSHHPNIEYILKNYGVEKFINYFGSILTSNEFLEKYPDLIKRLALNCLNCQSIESKQFLIRAFDSLKNVGYYRHELVLACLGSKENNCKQFILELLPLLLKNNEAYELVNKCASMDTDVCEEVIQKALEPTLNGIDDPNFVICIGSKTKSCIDNMPKIFAASTESRKGDLEFYCSKEKKMTLPQLIEPIAASRALTLQTACNRLFHSTEFQDFKNPPSFLTQAKHLLWKFTTKFLPN